MSKFNHPAQSAQARGCPFANCRAGICALIHTGLITAMLVTLGAGAAHAQLSNLDPSTLIDGLAREGMSELLEHLIETEPPDDPVTTAQVVIAQHWLEYNRLRDEAARASQSDPAAGEELRGRARQHFDKILGKQRDLIETYEDHVQRPLWQTDLSQKLLEAYIENLHTRADLFYEFGVCRTDQREAFESAVAESLVMLTDADLRFFQLQGELPKQDDFKGKYENSGLWNRMINNYWKKRTQYYLAYAAHYVSLLPVSHTYYQTLGNPRMPIQRRDATQERERLRSQAASVIEPFAAKSSKLQGLQRRALSLAARSAVAMGRFDEAAKLIEQIREPKIRDAIELTADLTNMVMLDKKDDHEAAMVELRRVIDHPAVRNELAYRVLVVDLMHRLKLNRALVVKNAAARKAAVSDAYDVYTTILNDKSLGDALPAIRDYIFRRWEQSLSKDADYRDLPSMVLLALTEQKRIAAQNVLFEVNELVRAERFDEAEEKQKDVLAPGNAVLEICKVLLKRQDLKPAVHAAAMFNQGRAIYYIDPNNDGNVLKGMMILVDLARQFPDQLVGLDAISDAEVILRQLHTTSPGKPTDDAYRRLAKVLMNAYADKPVAHNARKYYAAFVLIPAGELAEAVSVLVALPFGHVDYFEGHRVLIETMMGAYKAGNDLSGAASAEAIQQHAQRLSGEAERAIQSGGDHVDKAHDALAVARLVDAELAIADGRGGDAVDLIDAFEREFANEPDLIAQAVGLRIEALADAGDFERLKKAAVDMIDRFPDDAEIVIADVLTLLEQRINTIRRQIHDELVGRNKAALEARSRNLANAAAPLAQILIDWAHRRGVAGDDLIPFDLIRVKAWILAGKPDDARRALQPLVQKYPDDPVLVNLMGEALFTAGGESNMIDAAGQFDRLIEGVPQDESGRYPPEYWNAWMRRLQIMEKLGQETQEIGLTVRQLEMFNPALGGEPYLSEFRRLRMKYPP
jgi:hypothetical protein